MGALGGARLTLGEALGEAPCRRTARFTGSFRGSPRTAQHGLMNSIQCRRQQPRNQRRLVEPWPCGCTVAVVGRWLSTGPGIQASGPFLFYSLFPLVGLKFLSRFYPEVN